jgi:hypothetical protein
MSESRKRLFREDPGLRERISEARRKGERKRLSARDPSAISEKRCSKCGERKPLRDFTSRTEKLKCGLLSVHPESACRQCNRERRREWEAKKRAEGFDFAAQTRKYYSRCSPEAKERQRELNRERAAAKRRKEGAKARGSYKLNGNTDRSEVDAAPIIALLDEHDNPTNLVGLHPRRLYSLNHREQRRVSLVTVDAILSALDCQEELHELYPCEEKPVGYQILDPDGVLE